MTGEPWKFGVVVLSYNGLQDTRKCLASVVDAVRDYVTVYLVDNGSTDATAEAVSVEFPWCRIVTVPVNRGPAAGNNAGIRAALADACDWILLLNNDTTVASGLVDRLAEAAAAHTDYAVLGPVILFMDSPDTVMTDGCIFNDPSFNGFFQRKEVPVTNAAPPRVTEVDVVNGCCMLVRADVFGRAGLFDEHLFIYHDETDFCLRAKAAGYRAGVIDHALVWHKGSATSKATGKKSIRYFDARNLLYVLRKHEGATAHGRTKLGSAWGYARYMFYWYCSEREAGNDAAAAAVVDGVCDGLAGRGGAYTARRRLFAAPIRIVFEVMRRRPQALRATLS